MKSILLYIFLVASVFASTALKPVETVGHEWRIVSDNNFFNFVDSVLEVNDSTPFVNTKSEFRQRVQRAKRYYKVVVDNDTLNDSIVLNDGKPHKIHISQHQYLKYDVKSTVKYKDRVYFFTSKNADVFSSLPFEFLLSYSTIRPCLPGQEWEFEYTAPAAH